MLDPKNVPEITLFRYRHPHQQSDQGFFKLIQTTLSLPPRDHRFNGKRRDQSTLSSALNCVKIIVS